MRQAQINVRTRACSRTSIARTKQAALTHNVRGKELIYSKLCKTAHFVTCLRFSEKYAALILQLINIIIVLYIDIYIYMVTLILVPVFCANLFIV